MPRPTKAKPPKTPDVVITRGQVWRSRDPRTPDRRVTVNFHSFGGGLVEVLGSAPGQRRRSMLKTSTFRDEYSYESGP